MTDAGNIYLHSYSDHAEVANWMLAERMARYPKLVEAKRVTQAEADKATRIAQAIAQLWHARVTGQPVPQLDATRAEMLAEMLAEMQTAAQRQRERGSGRMAANMAQCMDAMAYHLRSFSETLPDSNLSALQFCHELTLKMRAAPEQERRAA